MAVIGFADAGSAVLGAGALRRRLASVQALELFADAGLELVMRHAEVAAPFAERHPFYLLVEAGAVTGDVTDELVAALDACGLSDPAVVADDEAGRHRLWQLRERHTEVINAEGVPHKLDVSVPAGRLAELVERAPAAVSAVDPIARTILYGHAGDGNLHVNVLGPDPDDAGGRRRGARARPRARRKRQRRAWRRGGQGGLARAGSRRGRGRRDACDQARVGPARDPQPRRHLQDVTAHAHPESAAAAGSRRLLIVLALVLGFAVVEVLGGLLTNSLALWADAGHMATDAAGLILALLAIRIGQRPATPERSFGYARVEILAAVANSVILFVVAAVILVEALGRIGSPPEVLAAPMLAIAAMGLAVNVVAIRLLHAGAQRSLNLRGAYLEVMGDLFGSVAVLVAGSRHPGHGLDADRHDRIGAGGAADRAADVVAAAGGDRGSSRGDAPRC